jgi:hypothetical protein|tara:strand:- start:383 stop:733 length:351 start_codon:yes stop_codon:yes gene_type:complete
MDQIFQEFQTSTLRELGKKHAVALRNLTQLEESKKILKASIMSEYQIGANGKPNSVAAQEVMAYADDRYQKHINALADAIQIEAELKWQKRTVEINLELIKVQSFNANAEKKAYNI